MRVVSLLPSATEIVCALGRRDALVGVSHECDYPADVRRLPRLTRPKVRADGTSTAIDREVRDLVRQGLSVYEIDVERLQALAPDVIVTQDQCAVCAVSYADVTAAARAVLGSAVTIVSLSPRVLGDVWHDVERVAAALDRRGRGGELATACKERLAALAGRTVGLGRPVVACVEWLDPLMVAGNWVPELVEIAGGAYPFAEPGAASATTSWATLAAARPQVVVLTPCGFTIAQTRREVGWIVARPEWRALPAVAAGRVSIVDGNAYVNRPGPRIVESAEILANLIHPEACAVAVPPGAVEPLIRRAQPMPGSG
jgi:iron complex transport system substrate-binding protein